MRSLPPPRITRKRQWRRFKRAMKYFFKKGKCSDPDSYEYRSKSQNISKIKQLRLSSRIRRTRRSKSEGILRKGTNVSISTASFMGRVIGKASLPNILRPAHSTNLLNLSVNIK